MGSTHNPAPLLASGQYCKEKGLVNLSAKTSFELFGHMGFKAPRTCRSFFQNLTLASVRAKINKQISW